MVTNGPYIERKQKLTETVEVVNLLEPERVLLLNLLRDYHDIFALEENERSEIDLIQWIQEMSHLLSNCREECRLQLERRQQNNSGR